jgi:hypothetical protein
MRITTNTHKLRATIKELYFLVEEALKGGYTACSFSK